MVTILYTVPSSALYWLWHIILTKYQVCRPGAGASAQLHAVGCHTALVSRLEVTTVPSILTITRPLAAQVHSLHIVAALLLTTLLHGAAVMAAFCLARWVWLDAFKYPA